MTSTKTAGSTSWRRRISLGFGAMLGDGAGHFTAGSVVRLVGSGGYGPVSPSDVDRDSHLDVVTAGFVRCCAGTAPRTSMPLEALHSRGRFLSAPGRRDFNEDGKLDLGVDGVRAIRPCAAGRRPGRVLDRGERWIAVVGITPSGGLGDFNGDLHLDLVGPQPASRSACSSEMAPALCAAPMTTPCELEPGFRGSGLQRGRPFRPGRVTKSRTTLCRSCSRTA